MIKMGMASFNVSMTLVLFALLCLSREAAASEYIYHSCSDKITFTPNSTFQSNQHHLLSSLSSNATREDGFYRSTVGQNASDAVYGLFLCRGDLTVQDCQECVGNATQDLIRQYCPLGKEGVIWYEECMLRYSDQYLFSNMSMHPSVYVPSRRKVHDPDRFNHLLMATMKGLVSQVANVEIGAKKYATKEANFMGSQILYTLEQCTPDISSFACSMCIQQAIALLPNCCSGIEGARVTFPSCRIRYEIYQFYLMSMPPILPPPPPGKRKILIRTIILIVALISVSAVLFIMSYYFRCRRENIEYNAMDEGALQLDVATIELLPLKLLR